MFEPAHRCSQLTNQCIEKVSVGYKSHEDEVGLVSWLQDGGVPVHVSTIQCIW